MISIETKNLEKKYGNNIAVNKINLSINEGELFSLLGVNGAGKTTTIKMLSCLSKPTSGEAFILEFNIKKDQYKIKSILNISPQETAIAPNLTVRENLDFIAGIYGIPYQDRIKKVNDTIKEFKFDNISEEKSIYVEDGKVKFEESKEVLLYLVVGNENFL